MPYLAQNTVDILSQIAKDPSFGAVTTFTAPAAVTVAVRLSLVVAGTSSFFFLVWGSTQWILAGGDKEGIDKARKKITGALIGLSLVLSTFAIVKLMQIIFGVDILGTLTIPTI